MVPRESDTSFACDFAFAHICGYTSNTLYVNTMSRALILQEYYLIFGAQDDGSDAALLSPVVSVLEDTCLQIYIYCKDCNDYPYWLLEQLTDLDDAPSDLNDGDLSLKGSVIEAKLPLGTYRIKLYITFTQGWVILQKIDTVHGQCPGTGKSQFS